MRVYAQQSEQLVDLTEQVGVGEKGTVFDWPLDPRLVCKVYHESVLQERGAVLDRKLTAMLVAAPEDPMLARGLPIFAWPEELVFDPANRKRLVGFVMPRIANSYPLHKLYSSGDRKQLALPPDEEGQTRDYQVMVQTARNLAEAFRLLHAGGHVMANVNEEAIRFRTDGTVALIDNDAFQVWNQASGEKFLVPMLKSAYWPVDSLRLHARREALRTSHDDFELAQFLFRLLMNGVHPYHGMGARGTDPPSTVDNIKAGHFPFVPARSGGLRPPPHAPAFESLPAELRGMFERCFVEGTRNPSARADAATWVEALDRAQNSLKRCQRGHLHFGEARLCPWCVLEDALTVCPNGHKYYRAEGSCPRCALEQKRAARRTSTASAAPTTARVPGSSRPAQQAVGVGSPTPVRPTPVSPAPARPARVSRTPVSLATVFPTAVAPDSVFPDSIFPDSVSPAPVSPASVPTDPPSVFPGFADLLRNGKVGLGIGALGLLILVGGLVLNRPGLHGASDYSTVGQTNRSVGANFADTIGAPPPVLQTNARDGAVEVLIPAGSFEMGDLDIGNNPPHTVKLSAYWIYKNLVTVGQYKKYVAAMKASGQKVDMPAAPLFNPNWTYENHPIVNVSWNDAQGYCKWAGARLPTEAQWEMAARGTEGQKYPWGNYVDAAKVWSSVNGAKSGTHSVGAFDANYYRVADMAGNAWQWCQDGYDANFWKRSADQSLNPINNTNTGARVLRGGAWSSRRAVNLRSAGREWGKPDGKGSNIGFRCVVSADSR